MTDQKPAPDIARSGRIAALGIAGGGLLAILAPGIVYLTGLPPRYEMLFYLFSLAAFIWSLSIVVRMWQKTRK